MLTVENEKYAIECDSDGIIIIRNKNEGDETHLLIFNDKYQYLYKQWDVEPRLYLPSELEYLIVTYGIGYIYIIDLCIKKIVRNYILFPEISYDDDSYQKIDTCCYYNEATEIVKAGDRTKREREVYKLEYDKLMEEFVCNSVLRYKRRKINGTKRFGEKIFDRNRICKKI